MVDFFTGIAQFYANSTATLFGASFQLFIEFMRLLFQSFWVGFISILSLLPAGGHWPAFVTNAFTQMGGYLAVIDFIFPVKTLLLVMSFVFTVKLTFFMFHLGRVGVFFVRGIPVAPNK